jgi:divalent metal cation (Fe/Co/Zn/Cd) transporter
MSEHSLHKRALLLEYLTIIWNVLEGAVSMGIGILAGSVSLFAYGLESSIEVFASGVTVWHLKGGKKGREKLALKLIGGAYLIASLYIFLDALQSLIKGHHPHATLIGIVFLILTVFVMLILGLLKKHVGNKLKNAVVLADAKFTLIDGALSSAVLVGLVVNALFGWWWTDQALALFLSGVAFKEGIQEFV